jgi:heme/copper-type cytochrome/quinol oxidase subunit 2
MTARPDTTGISHLTAPSIAPGQQRNSNPFDGAHSQDNLSLVLWSLFIALVFLVPVVGVMVIRWFQ